MLRFRRSEKELAKRLSYDELRRKYDQSERALDRAARRGDFKAMNKAMKLHHGYEYALLWQKAGAKKK